MPAAAKMDPAAAATTTATATATATAAAAASAAARRTPAGPGPCDASAEKKPEESRGSGAKKNAEDEDDVKDAEDGTTTREIAEHLQGEEREEKHRREARADTGATAVTIQSEAEAEALEYETETAWALEHAPLTPPEAPPAAANFGEDPSRGTSSGAAGRRSSDATIMSDSEDEARDGDGPQSAADEDALDEETDTYAHPEDGATASRRNSIGSNTSAVYAEKRGAEPSRPVTTSVEALNAALGPAPGADADAGAGAPPKAPMSNSSAGAFSPPGKSSLREVDMASIRTSESTATFGSGYSESTEGDFTPTERPAAKAGFETDSAMMRLLSRGIRIFNLNPKRGIEFIQANDLVHRVPNDDAGNARRVAIFLKHTRGLNKEQIGKVLGGETPQQIAILNYYFVLFDLSEYGPTVRGLERALRSVFECFKPPGEAQKIQRILETFADKFNEDNKMSGDEPNPEAEFLPATTFLLAYAIIILNVDLHNPNNPRKMLRREFVSNLRSVDKELPPDALATLYDHIARHQMRHKVDRDEVAGDLFTHPDKSGWLQKKGPTRLSKWRPRWFILSESTLWYFKHSEDVEPQGFIPLENVLIRTCLDPPAPTNLAGRGSATPPPLMAPLAASAHSLPCSPASPATPRHQLAARMSSTGSESSGPRPRDAAGQDAGAYPSSASSSSTSLAEGKATGASGATSRLARPLSLPAKAVPPDLMYSSEDEASTPGSGSSRRLVSRKSATMRFRPSSNANSPAATAASRQSRSRNFWFELYMWDDRLNVKSARLSKRTGNFELGQHRTIKLRADSRQEMEQWVELLNRKGRFSQSLQDLTMRARFEQQLHPPASRPASTGNVPGFIRPAGSASAGPKIRSAASSAETPPPSGVRLRSARSSFFRSLFANSLSHSSGSRPSSPNCLSQPGDLGSSEEDLVSVNEQINRASSIASAPLLKTDCA